MQNKINIPHNHTDSMHDNESTWRHWGYSIIAVVTYELASDCRMKVIFKIEIVKTETLQKRFTILQ